MLRDEVRVDDDERIARHILEVRTQGISETKLDEAMEFDLRETEEGEIFGTGVDGSEHLTVEFLRKYIAYAKRNVNPDLSDDAKALILEYYTNERQSFGRDQQQYAETEVIPITPRALEALIRLTEAHARMHLREVASADDAKMALAIFRHWREEAGIEDESELASGVSVSQRNAGNTVRSIIRDLCSDKGVAELTDILNRSETRGVNEYQVEEVLSRMLQGGELFEISHERYSFAR